MLSAKGAARAMPRDPFMTGQSIPTGSVARFQLSSPIRTKLFQTLSTFYVPLMCRLNPSSDASFD